MVYNGGNKEWYVAGWESRIAGACCTALVFTVSTLA